MPLILVLMSSDSPLHPVPTSAHQALSEYCGQLENTMASVPKEKKETNAGRHQAALCQSWGNGPLLWSGMYALRTYEMLSTASKL